MDTLKSTRNFLRDISKDAQQRILTALANNNSRKTAVKIAQVSPAKFNQYMKAAQQLDDSEDEDDFSETENALVEFYRAVCAAEANAEANAVMNINRASSDDWRAAAHILKYRNKDDWGDVPPPVKGNPSVLDSEEGPRAKDITENPKLDLNQLTVEEVIEFERLIRKATVQTEVIGNSPAPRQLPDHGGEIERPRRLSAPIVLER